MTKGLQRKMSEVIGDHEVIRVRCAIWHLHENATLSLRQFAKLIQYELGLNDMLERMDQRDEIKNFMDLRKRAGEQFDEIVDFLQMLSRGVTEFASI